MWTQTSRRDARSCLKLSDLWTHREFLLQDFSVRVPALTPVVKRCCTLKTWPTLMSGLWQQQQQQQQLGSQVFGRRLRWQIQISVDGTKNFTGVLQMPHQTLGRTEETETRRSEDRGDRRRMEGGSNNLREMKHDWTTTTKTQTALKPKQTQHEHQNITKTQKYYKTKMTKTSSKRLKHH